jgi:hypothetical protein
VRKFQSHVIEGVGVAAEGVAATLEERALAGELGVPDQSAQFRQLAAVEGLFGNSRSQALANSPMK